MTPTPLTMFLASAALFVVVVLFVQAERKKGKRLVFSHSRGLLDIALINLNLWSKEQWRHFVRYILQLGWYYSLHSFLEGAMRLLVAVYDYIEGHFERNRLRTRDLRAEKRHKTGGHFAAVAEHKAEVALTPEEGKDLREKKLEEKH